MSLNERLAEEMGKPGEKDGGQPNPDTASKAQETRTSDSSPNPDLVTVKVDGKELQITRDELIAGYQKGASADKRFQEAASARQFQEDFHAARQGDVGALRRVAKSMGASEEEIEAYLKDAQGQASGTGKQPQPQRKSESKKDESAEYEELLDELAEALEKRLSGKYQPKGRVGINELDPKVARALAHLYDRDLESDLEKKIDGDAVLGDYIKYGSEKQIARVRAIVRDKVERRMRAGQDYRNPNLVATALQEARQELADLGFQPEKKKSNRAPLLGLGSPDESASTFHPEKPVERPKEGIAAPDYGDFILDRLLHLKMEQGDE